MTKNKRITSILNNIASEFQQITKILSEIDSKITKILSETDSIVATDPSTDSGAWGRSPVSQLSEGSRSAVHLPHMRKWGRSPVSQLSEGDERTAAINKNNTISDRFTSLLENPRVMADITTLSDTKLITKIDSNSTTVFYKRNQGLHRGSIITVNKKTNAITDHKYLVTSFLTKQLCLVSKDQDGLDYVKNYVRPSVIARVANANAKLSSNVSPQLVRFYRRATKNTRKPTHSAVYLRERYEIRYEM